MRNPDYEGYTEAVARETAECDGLRVRIACRDGKHFVLTADYRTDRVNFEVREGCVVRSYIG